MSLRERFLLKYTSMTKEQKLEIFTIDGEPYTWNPIWIEVLNKTKLSTRFLKHLESLDKI